MKLKHNFRSNLSLFEIRPLIIPSCYLVLCPIRKLVCNDCVKTFLIHDDNRNANILQTSYYIIPFLIQYPQTISFFSYTEEKTLKCIPEVMNRNRHLYKCRERQVPKAQMVQISSLYLVWPAFQKLKGGPLRNLQFKYRPNENSTKTVP